jgi:hypothetical protein
MSSAPANDNNNNNQNQGAQQQQQIKKLPCDHIFHKNCLRSWFQRQQTCPTCRTSILRMNNQNQQLPQQQNQQQQMNAQAQAPGQQAQGSSQPQQPIARNQQANTPSAGSPPSQAQSSQSTPRLAQTPSAPVIQTPLFSLNSPSGNPFAQQTSHQSNETNPLLNNLFSTANLPLPPFGI